MKMKMLISLIAAVLIFNVVFTIGVFQQKRTKKRREKWRIESTIKEVLGDDVKKQTETVLAGTIKYSDKEGSEINYHILKTTYFEADPTEVTGLNVVSEYCLILIIRIAVLK